MGRVVFGWQPYEGLVNMYRQNKCPNNVRAVTAPVRDNNVIVLCIAKLITHFYSAMLFPNIFFQRGAKFILPLYNQCRV